MKIIRIFGLVVLCALFWAGGYYLGNQQNEVTVQDAKEKLQEYCILQYQAETNEMFVIVEDSSIPDLYKNLGVLEEHYNNLRVMHISQLGSKILNGEMP